MLLRLRWITKEAPIQNRVSEAELWLPRLKVLLANEGYSRPATKNYCMVARRFLRYLNRRKIRLESVRPPEVESFLRARLAQYRRKHRREPRCANDWHWHHMAPIQLFLRLAQGQWPPANEIDSRLAWFRAKLEEAGQKPRTVRRYLEVNRRFLTHLGRQAISPEDAQPADVSHFIQHELTIFRKKLGQLPESIVDWRCGLTPAVHYLLRLLQGEWPPSSSIHPWLLTLRQHLEQECPASQTRLHYLHECHQFLAYLEVQGLALETVEPAHVDAYCGLKLRVYRKRHGRPPKNLHRWRLAAQAPVHRLLRLVHAYWPPESRPDPSVEAFREHLVQEGFSPTVIPSKLSAVRVFLRFLRTESIPVEAIKLEHVASYLDTKLALFRRTHGRLPANVDYWRYGKTGPIHRYLQLIRGKWPPESLVTDELELSRRELCARYGGWLTELQGFSPETLRKNGDAARIFLQWLGERAQPQALRRINVADVDAFLAWRNPGLRRATRHGVSQCLRSFLRYLYGEGLLEQDLAPHVTSPSQYLFENIPSTLSDQQVKTLLEATHADRRPSGLRDYAILLLIKTYGLRAGEVTRLRLEDIDWRRDQIRIRQSKTGADLFLPLMPSVGNALLDYLRQGRPKTHLRQVFIRMSAPRGPFTCGSSLYAVFARRLARAGIQAQGRRGPHALRYARAVELLRASVPLKSIGDVLGHRSAQSTQVYLKLATEDLRSVALEIPAGARQ